MGTQQRRFMMPRRISDEYVANASNFDGTTYWNKFSGDLDAPFADSKVFTFSAWINPDTDGTEEYVLHGLGNNYNFRKESVNRFNVIVERASDNTNCYAARTGINSVLAASGWIHVFASGDMADVNSAGIWLNGVKSDTEDTSPIDSVINWTNVDHAIGSSASGGGKFNGCMSEVYLNTDEYLDGNIATNIALFRDGAGKPVDLGSDGSIPTPSNPPVIYLPDADASNNKGYGGNYTVQAGSLTACSDAP